MREMLKMMVVLSLICGLAGVTLAYLKDMTALKIEEQVLTYVQAPVLEQVLTAHDNQPVKDRQVFETGGAKVMVFPALKDGHLTGVAFETSGKGYGGDIGVMVGFDLTADTISGIGITTMKETPGVGTRVAEHGYTSQYKGHAVEAVALKSQGGDIDAVAGATISSAGAVNAVQEALRLFQALKGQLAEKWS